MSAAMDLAREVIDATEVDASSPRAAAVALYAQLVGGTMHPWDFTRAVRSYLNGQYPTASKTAFKRTLRALTEI